MKTTLKLTTLLLVSTLFSTTLCAYEEESTMQNTEMAIVEQTEAQEQKALDRAELIETKIEIKKEQIRTRLEARGVPYDEIEDYIDGLFPV